MPDSSPRVCSAVFIFYRNIAQLGGRTENPGVVPLISSTPSQTLRSCGRKSARHYPESSTPAIASTPDDSSDNRSTPPSCCSPDMSSCTSSDSSLSCSPSFAVHLPETVLIHYAKEPYYTYHALIAQRVQKCSSTMSLSCKMCVLCTFWPGCTSAPQQRAVLSFSANCL